MFVQKSGTVAGGGYYLALAILLSVGAGGQMTSAGNKAGADKIRESLENELINQLNRIDFKSLSKNTTHIFDKLLKELKLIIDSRKFNDFEVAKKKVSDVMKGLNLTQLARPNTLPLNNSNTNLSGPNLVYFCNRKLAKLSEPCLCYVDFAKPSIRCAMSYDPGGRMGNFIGQYAALMVLSRLNGRPSLMTPLMGDSLKPYFKLSMPQLSSQLAVAIPWSRFRIYDLMKDSYKNFSGLFVQLLGFPSSNTFLQGSEAELRREFRVHEHIRERAQKVLRDISRGRSSTTFIGVHVRRGDYIYWMEYCYHGVLADRNYFLKATDYFRSKYHDAAFVVISNDMKWCRENIPNDRKDVFYAGNSNESDPITDFATLMSCNHSIITIGTYGFFAAFFAGGDTVYFTNFTKPDSEWNKFFYSESAFPKKWHPIAADLSLLYPELKATTAVATKIPTKPVLTTKFTSKPVLVHVQTTAQPTVVPTKTVTRRTELVTTVPLSLVRTTSVPKILGRSTTIQSTAQSRVTEVPKTVTVPKK